MILADSFDNISWPGALVVVAMILGAVLLVYVIVKYL